jgi:hypothetical protein
VHLGARVPAAELGTSLSALVAEHLSRISSQALDFARLEAREQRVREGIRRFEAGNRLGRDELHDRPVR